MGPVFISYSSADKAVADRICVALEAGGCGCWIAPRDIEPGADYATSIVQAIERSGAMVVVVSAAAVASPHVLSEVGHAFGKKKPLVPFRLTDTQLPANFDYFLSMSQWLDAHDDGTGEDLARLQEAVSQALAGGAAPVAGRPPHVRRNVLAAAAVLIVLAAAGYWLWPSRDTRAGGLRPAVNPVPPAPAGEGVKTAEVRPEPWVNPKDGLRYVWIPPGAFAMGCSPGDSECQPDEYPSHPVDLPRGFWLGETEVTNAAYRRVVPSWSYPAGESSLPVAGVSWSEAKHYCAAVGGRLPSEAEWEYAARGGTTGAYYGAPLGIAWFGANSGGIRHAVATRKPNAYGLFDMLGSVSEWVLDRYYNKYDVTAPAISDVEQPTASNATAVTRGGFWESEAPNIRVSHRAQMENDEPGPMAGIRCVAERR